MNGNLGILILCVCVICGLFEGSEASAYLKPEIEKYESGETVSFSNDDVQARKVAPTLYQTVNKYYCSLDSILEDDIPSSNDTRSSGRNRSLSSHLILFGTNGWIFPVQDVNLTLTYPPNVHLANDPLDYNKEEIRLPSEDEDYLVTGFKVIIYIDGDRTEGYIVDGGVLQESITLSFVSSQVTTLMYEFWLYGARKDTPGVAELNSHYRLC